MSFIDLTKLLADTGVVESRSEARRAVTMGRVNVNGSTVTDISSQVSLEEGAEVQVGKRTTLRLVSGRWERS